MRLNDYVKQKVKEAFANHQVYCPFGLTTDGNFVNSWQMNYARIELFTKFHGIDEFSSQKYIQIFVERTGSGIDPNNAKDMPLGWNGKINEHTADMAVWWAFEILTEDEATSFYLNQRPTVTFTYQEQGKQYALKTKHDGTSWTIVYDSKS